MTGREARIARGRFRGTLALSTTLAGGMLLTTPVAAQVLPIAASIPTLPGASPVPTPVPVLPIPAPVPTLPGGVPAPVPVLPIPVPVPTLPGGVPVTVPVLPIPVPIPTPPGGTPVAVPVLPIPVPLPTLPGGTPVPTPLPTPSLPSVNPIDVATRTNPGTLLNPSLNPVMAQLPVGGTPTLSIDLRATSTIIDWKGGFNIPEGTVAVFNDARGSAAVRSTPTIAVLNRDLTGNVSQLRGTLSSAGNVAVWVFNPAGILVGSGAVINTGSLVLTTLPPNESDFLGGGGNYRFAGTAGSSAAIRIERGAAVTLKSGGNRGLILLAPDIDAAGTFDAGNQDVAFVTATDVTLAYDINSPLSVTLNRGTSVGRNRGQLVGGTVAGRNVLFALASQGTVTDALLQVDASVTTATASAHGIVLSAGASAAAVGGLTVTGDSAATGGGAALTATGALTSRATGAGVIASATGTATVAGSVATGGDYALTGRDVVVGGAIATAQQADGAVTITATNGTLSGTAGLVLQANADGVGAEPLSLITGEMVGGTTGGNIALAPGSWLVAGSVSNAGLANRESDILVRVHDSSSRLALGNLAANELQKAVGPSAPFVTGLSTSNDLTLGAVELTGALSLRSAALTTGQIRSGGDVTLAANGSVTLGAIASGGAVSITGTGDATIGTVQATGPGGKVAIDRDGMLSVGGFATTGDVVIGGAAAPRSIAVAGASTIGGTLTATALNGQQWAGPIVATGPVRLTGSVLTTAAVYGRDLALIATGAVRSTGALTATAGDLTVSGSDTILGNLSSSGATTVTATAGDAVVASGLSGGGFALNAGRTATVSGDLDVGSLSIAADAVDLGTATRQTSSGNIDIVARSGDIGGGSRLASTASGGVVTVKAARDLSIGSVASVGETRLNIGGDAVIDAASGSTLRIDAGGGVGGRAGGRTALTTTAGDLTIAAGGKLQLAAVTSAGAASLSGDVVDASGKLAAARALLTKARDALTLSGGAASGGDLTLQAGGAITAGQLTAGGGVAITGGNVQLATVGAGGALSLTATSASAESLAAGADLNATTAGSARLLTLRAGGALAVKAGDFAGGSATAATTLTITSVGDLTLDNGGAGGAALFEAGKLATLGTISAGPSIALRAADAELTGPQQAAAIAIQNRAPETGALRLGDGTAGGGFRLSNAEVARLAADTVVFDQGGGAVEIGTLGFTAAAGRKAATVLSTGTIDIDGVVSGSGVGRRFRIGGSAASETDTARSIMVAATSAAGGRLLFDDADLELRGGRVAAGLAPGFIGVLSSGGTEVASGFVGNGNSTLYNANLGGGSYASGASTILTARTLTIRYADYALFQNTGVAGLTSGAVLGGTLATPVSPALILTQTGGSASSFALFGTINGVGATAAALLGKDVSAQGVNLATARINGCPIGSGSGCLATVVIKPTLQVFNSTSTDVFGVSADLTVPFEPVVGGINEESIAGIDAARPASPIPLRTTPPPVIQLGQGR